MNKSLGENETHFLKVGLETKEELETQTKKPIVFMKFQKNLLSELTKNFTLPKHRDDFSFQKSSQ